MNNRYWHFNRPMEAGRDLYFDKDSQTLTPGDSVMGGNVYIPRKDKNGKYVLPSLDISADENTFLEVDLNETYYILPPKPHYRYIYLETGAFTLRKHILLKQIWFDMHIKQILIIFEPDAKAKMNKIINKYINKRAYYFDDILRERSFRYMIPIFHTPLDKLVDLFSCFAKDSDPDDHSIQDVIIPEIKNFYKIASLNINQNHFLPLTIPGNYCDNAEGKSSTELIHFIGKFGSPENFTQAKKKEFLHLLSSGENINQIFSEVGHIADPGAKSIFTRSTPISLAMIARNWEMIYMLLENGAHPFLPSHYSNNISPVVFLEINANGSRNLHEEQCDFAIRRNIRRNIDSYYSRISKRVSSNASFYIFIQGVEKGILTTFINNDIIIYSLLKNSCHLSKNEKTNLQEIFNNAFAKTTKSLSAELSNANTLVDLIFYQNKLIGFFIFNIYNLDSYQTLIVHDNYAYIDKAFRQNKFSLLMTARLGPSLQLLLPLQKIARYASILNDKSYALHSQFTHFPKQDPGANIHNIIHSIIDMIYSSCTKRLIETPIAFVEDGSSTSENFPNKQTNMNYLYHYILGNAFLNLPKDSMRAAMIFYYVCDEVYLKLSALIKLNFGTDFFKHIYQLAKHLKIIIPDIVQDNTPMKTPQFFKMHSLFWHDRKKISTLPLASHPLNSPAKL